MTLIRHPDLDGTSSLLDSETAARGIPGRDVNVPDGRARVWKDRETGRWCLDVQGYGLRSTGDSATWHGALAAALDDLRWIGKRQHAWPRNLLALGWRP